MRRRKWLIAAAGATLVVVLGAGAVMAQSPGHGIGTSFLDRVAQKLGIDTPKLQKAITDTRNEDIDSAVANGDIGCTARLAISMPAACAFGQRSI